MSKKRLIIIGSGMTGITIASNLDPEKFEIQILDKGRRVGGRMASKKIGRAHVRTPVTSQSRMPSSA